MNRALELIAQKRVLSHVPEVEVFEPVDILVVENVSPIQSVLQVQNGVEEFCQPVQTRNLEILIEAVTNENFCRRVFITRLDREEFREVCNAMDKEVTND